MIIERIDATLRWNYRAGNISSWIYGEYIGRVILDIKSMHSGIIIGYSDNERIIL